MDRIAIFGDVGGHADELYSELVRLGCDPDPATWARDGWPADLVVVQAGDLVDGPDDEACIAMWQSAPEGRWVQIVGNHEVRYLGGPTFSGPSTSAAVRALLRDLDDAHLLRPAVALDIAGWGQTLVTHAGCSAGFVTTINCASSDAARVAETLNGLWDSGNRQRRATVWRPGKMLAESRFGSFVDPQAGCVWASAAAEVWPSWEARTMNFAQVHGHAQVYLWDKGAWLHTARNLIDRDTRSDAGIRVHRNAPGVQRCGDGLWGLDTARRHVWWRPAGGPPIVAIDPAHRAQAAPNWAPLVLTGRVLDG